MRKEYGNRTDDSCLSVRNPHAVVSDEGWLGRQNVAVSVDDDHTLLFGEILHLVSPRIPASRKVVHK